jgi:hypothetical protein
MPLTRIHCDHLDIRDVTPLLSCPTLTHIILPRSAENPEALCKLPNLKRIAYSYDHRVHGPSLSIAEFLASRKTALPSP